MMLKGKELQERARELNIPGRSKMTADELRAAVTAYEEKWSSDNEPELPEWDGEGMSMFPPPAPIHDQHSAILRQAAGLDSETVAENYRRQNGSDKLTHRQRRRIRKRMRQEGQVA